MHRHQTATHLRFAATDHRCKRLPTTLCAMLWGRHMVTIKTTVSVSNLISFSKAKGSKVEFAGSLFGANLRLIESAQKNERIVFDHFIKQVEIFLDNCGPFTTPKILESSPKKSSDGTYHIELKMRDVQTDVPGKLYTMLCDFLNSIALICRKYN